MSVRAILSGFGFRRYSASKMAWSPGLSKPISQILAKDLYSLFTLFVSVSNVCVHGRQYGSIEHRLMLVDHVTRMRSCYQKHLGASSLLEGQSEVEL